MSSSGESSPRLLTAALAFFFLLHVGAAVFYSALEGDPEQLDYGVLLAVQGAVSLALVGGAIFWGPPVSWGLTWSGRKLLGVVAAYAAFSLVWHTGLYFVYPPLLQALEVEFTPQPHLDWLVQSSGGSWLCAVFAVCVAGPLVEELIFRGYLQTGLSSMFGRRSAWLAASLCFGFAHGFLYALPLTLTGLFFGWMFLRTASLQLAVFAHAMHNILTLSIAVAFPDLMQL